MKRFFKYIEPLWTGRDGKVSLRSFGAIALLIDFVINVHNCSYIVIKVLKMIMVDKHVDAAVISSLAGYLAQITLLLGIEAGLIAALLALKTYQGNVEFIKTAGASVVQSSQTTVLNPGPTPGSETLPT
jgi:hypothetical protein